MTSGYCYPPVNRAVIDTGCYVTSIGVRDQKKGGRYPPAGHPDDYRFEWSKGRTLADVTVLGVARGTGLWETRRGGGRLTEGEVLYLPPREWHRYRPDEAVGWCEKWMCLRGVLIHQLIEKSLIPAQPQMIKCDNWSDWESRLDRLREEAVGSAGCNRLSWGARGLSILLELWEAQGGVTSQASAAAHGSDGIARLALGFIEQNSHRPILVEDVARFCARTRRTLERVFQKHCLVSISEAISASRVTRARYLLKDTTLSIKQVAGDAGFQSSQHFIATFRRRENCTPSEYRRR